MVEEVLALVARRIVDETIGGRLFANPVRLDEDILGRVTARLLDSVSSVRDFGTETAGPVAGRCEAARPRRYPPAGSYPRTA